MSRSTAFGARQREMTDMNTPPSSPERGSSIHTISLLFPRARSNPLVVIISSFLLSLTPHHTPSALYSVRSLSDSSRGSYSVDEQSTLSPSACTPSPSLHPLCSRTNGLSVSKTHIHHPQPAQPLPTLLIPDPTPVFPPQTRNSAGPSSRIRPIRPSSSSNQNGPTPGAWVQSCARAVEQEAPPGGGGIWGCVGLRAGVFVEGEGEGR